MSSVCGTLYRLFVALLLSPLVAATGKVDDTGVRPVVRSWTLRASLVGRAGATSRAGRLAT
eukprot:2099711-Pyramimonas_sp.AAC.1